MTARTIDWLPNWYHTRLHAFENSQGWSLCHSIHTPQNTVAEWQKRRAEKGIPRCKRCENAVVGYL